MKVKLIIIVLVVVAVSLVAYKLGYHAAVRDEAAITARNNCISNLRMLDGAKQQWALDNKKTGDDVPTLADLAPYMRGYGPICPTGGSYAPKRVDDDPICSVPGHALPTP